MCLKIIPLRYVVVAICSANNNLATVHTIGVTAMVLANIVVVLATNDYVVVVNDVHAIDVDVVATDVDDIVVSNDVVPSI